MLTPDSGKIEHLPFRWSSGVSLDELIRFAKFAGGGKASEFSVTRESLEEIPPSENFYLTLQELTEKCKSIALHTIKKGAQVNAGLAQEIHRRKLIRESMFEMGLDYEKLNHLRMRFFERSGELNDDVLKRDRLNSRKNFESRIRAGFADNVQLIITFLENKNEIEFTDGDSQLEHLVTVYSVLMYYLELFPEYEA